LYVFAFCMFCLVAECFGVFDREPSTCSIVLRFPLRPIGPSFLRETSVHRNCGHLMCPQGRKKKLSILRFLCTRKLQCGCGVKANTVPCPRARRQPRPRSTFISDVSLLSLQSASSIRAAFWVADCEHPPWNGPPQGLRSGSSSPCPCSRTRQSKSYPQKVVPITLRLQ
jgi:hypothetical protein